MTSPYAPIEDYGLVGNMRTAALVGKNGSVDWLCLPHFDSPSVFGAVLDHEKGGCFRIEADGGYATRQTYLPDSNVLVTHILPRSSKARFIGWPMFGLATTNSIRKPSGTSNNFRLSVVSSGSAFRTNA